MTTLWQPFEVEFAAFETDLKRLNREVNEEIRLASEQAAAKYRDGGIRFRESMMQWRSKDDARNMLVNECRRSE